MGRHLTDRAEGLGTEGTQFGWLLTAEQDSYFCWSYQDS